MNEEAINIWNIEMGEVTHRINYPLTPDSLVIDAGGYLGNFASHIFAKYQCEIHVYEPVQEYYKFIENRFLENDNIDIFPFGLSNETQNVEIKKSNDKSSLYLKTMEAFTIEGIALRKLSELYKDKKIDLLKLNVEGEEYNIFEDMFEHDLQNNIQNIQVQFHDIIEEEGKGRPAIQEKLSETHHLTYNFPFIFENWEKNT